MFAGNSVPKRQIPVYYVRRFGVNILFRYSHPQGFRSVYTLVRDDDDVSVVVLDFLSHKEYEKMFGY